jgi:hypothetical protein
MSQQPQLLQVPVVTVMVWQVTEVLIVPDTGNTLYFIYFEVVHVVVV